MTNDPRLGFIGAGIEIVGRVESTDRVFVAGRVDGEISASTVRIENGGKVVGAIRCEKLHVLGQGICDVDTRQVAIQEGGELRGRVRCGHFALADGAVFDGQIDNQPVESAGEKTPRHERES